MSNKYQQKAIKPVIGLFSIALLLLGSFILPAKSQDGPIRERIRQRIIRQSMQKGTQGNQWQNPERPLNHIIVNGMDRSYLLYVPKNHPSTAVPLVIALHGGGGNAYISEKMTQLAPLADEKGFILASANGSGPLKDRLLTWNTGNCCGYAYENKTDDVSFIRQMIGTLSKQYAIDPKRIYVTGMSNGGKMTYRLACQLSGTIAAIAPVAGSLDEPVCKPNSPISVIAFHGTADQHIRYNGGTPDINMDKRHPRTDRSVASAIQFWTRHNHCPAIPDKSKTGSIMKEVYQGCQGGSEVVLYSIEGGGHSWPGGSTIRNGSDQPTQEISASRLMVDFFLSHPKTE